VFGSSGRLEGRGCGRELPFAMAVGFRCDASFGSFETFISGAVEVDSV
jgi:hypothetical protein